MPGKAIDREAIDYAKQLREQTMACRVHHQKMYVRKSLTREQVALAAEQFSAASTVLTAAKKLIDTRDPTYRALVEIRGRASKYWKATTVPYPEPGVRLIRRDRIAQFSEQMTEFRAKLEEAAANLQAQYQRIKSQQRERLGDLFNSGDYPDRIDEEFGLDWDFPSIEPPAYLKDLHPLLYEQECGRIKARFEEALALTEQSFLSKFHEMIANLADRLSGEVDGKPKAFRSSAIENLNEFFEQFRAMDIGSNGELSALITQAQEAVKGLSPEILRGSDELRGSLGNRLTEIKTTLDGMMVNKPRRTIILEDDE